MSLYKKYSQQNAIVRIALFTILVKFLALIQYYLTDDAVGDVTLSLANALIYNFVYSTLIFSVLFFLWNLFTSVREIFNFSAFFFAFVTILISIVDLSLIRFTGMRFSPSIIKTYGISYIASPDVWLTLLDNPILSIAVALMFLMVILMFVFYKKIMKNNDVISYTNRQIGIISVVFLITWLIISNLNSSYYLSARPAEIAFFKTSSYRGKTALEFNQNDQERSNRLIQKYLGRKFNSENYPLLLTNKPDSLRKIEQAPDVFFIMIESLRGMELSFINKIDPANTPTIDSLAKVGVAFPKFTSNGYPTDDGMFSSHTSVLPHYNRKNVRDNVDTKYSSIPSLLKNQGYKTGMISAVKPFDPMMVWYKKWYEDFEYECGDHHCNEFETFQLAQNWVVRQDSANHGKPLFYYVHTNDLHLPFHTRFTIKSDSLGNRYYSDEVPEKMEDFHKRYQRTLESTDFALSKFFYFLSQRENKNNTIVVLLGDHGKEANEVFKRGTRLYPMNAMMITGAVISGPVKYIGEPRMENFPVSGVDVLPTLIDALNLNVKYASWGNNMLNENGKKISINVRPGGLRYNWGDSSLYINSYNPNDYWVSTFFDPQNDKTTYKNAKLNQMALDIYDMVQYNSYLIEEDLLID